MLEIRKQKRLVGKRRKRRIVAFDFLCVKISQTTLSTNGQEAVIRRK